MLGDLVGLPFLAAQLIQMIREDESEAAEIDAELDAREAERAARQADAPAGAEVSQGPGTSRGGNPTRGSRTGSRPSTTAASESVAAPDQEGPAAPGRSVAPTNSCDFIMHHAGTSVFAAGSSASTATTRPTGTSLIRSASMMIGIGHLRPSASIVSVGVGRRRGGCGGLRGRVVRGRGGGRGHAVTSSRGSGGGGRRSARRSVSQPPGHAGQRPAGLLQQALRAGVYSDTPARPRVSTGRRGTADSAGVPGGPRRLRDTVSTTGCRT